MDTHQEMYDWRGPRVPAAPQSLATGISKSTTKIKLTADESLSARYCVGVQVLRH